MSSENKDLHNMIVLINNAEPYLNEKIDFDLHQEGWPTTLKDHVDFDEQQEAAINEKQLIHENIQTKLTQGARQHFIEECNFLSGQLDDQQEEEGTNYNLVNRL